MRSGEMPATSVLHRTSLLSRSWGLLDYRLGLSARTFQHQRVSGHDLVPRESDESDDSARIPLWWNTLWPDQLEFC